MHYFESKDFDNHEKVMFCSDPDTGLKAIIAVHDRTLGPAIGGTRMWPYASSTEAITDVLRLSRGMTYKNAMAGLKLGGGKAVIIGNSRSDKTPELLRSYGRFVDSLNGHYITAEDVGFSPDDIGIVMQETDHVAGIPGKSGDPSPFTALGVYVGIKTAAKHTLGRSDLQGLKVAVQGVGSVGMHLCDHLHKAGAELVVSDINTESLMRAADEYGATIVKTHAIYGQDVDVYAPCALGATINDETLKMMKARIIAGAANNQLAEDRHGEILKERGILYAPDYVINAGGIINISFEQNYCAKTAEEKTLVIGNTLDEIFKRSDHDRRPTCKIANEMAREILAKASCRNEPCKVA